MKINRYYALHDNDSELKKQGAFAIKLEEANRYNDLGYGIFHTPNDFDGARRKENLIKINYWLADIDEGDKTEQYENILSLIYKPSKIIESKNGFHCYWKAKDATIANYTKIEQGIIQRLKADKGCKDVTRILRAPSFYHWKDKDNPYFVYEVYDFSDKKEYQYSEKTMLTAFAITENKYKYRPFKTRTEIDFGNPENWEKLFKLSHIFFFRIVHTPQH